MCLAVYKISLDGEKLFRGWSGMRGYDVCNGGVYFQLSVAEKLSFFGVTIIIFAKASEGNETYLKEVPFFFPSTLLFAIV